MDDGAARRPSPRWGRNRLRGGREGGREGLFLACHFAPIEACLQGPVNTFRKSEGAFRIPRDQISSSQWASRKAPSFASRWDNVRVLGRILSASHLQMLPLTSCLRPPPDLLPKRTASWLNQ